MRCYISDIISGKITLIEHLDGKWLTIDTIREVEWLPADLVVVERLIQRFGSKKNGR